MAAGLGPVAPDVEDWATGTVDGDAGEGTPDDESVVDEVLRRRLKTLLR